MKDSQINPYEHSDIKVKLLKLYLEKYINILALAKGVNKVEVFDLFCGEGIYNNGKEGIRNWRRISVRIDKVKMY